MIRIFEHTILLLLNLVSYDDNDVQVFLFSLCYSCCRTSMAFHQEACHCCHPRSSPGTRICQQGFAWRRLPLLLLLRPAVSVGGGDGMVTAGGAVWMLLVSVLFRSLVVTTHPQMRGGGTTEAPIHGTEGLPKKYF